MANPIRKLVDNSKKQLKKLNHIADQVESYADEMSALTSGGMRFSRDGGKMWASK